MEVKTRGKEKDLEGFKKLHAQIKSMSSWQVPTEKINQIRATMRKLEELFAEFERLKAEKAASNATF